MWGSLTRRAAIALVAGVAIVLSVAGIALAATGSREPAAARPASFDVRVSTPAPASDYWREELRIINDTPWWLHKQGGPSGPQFLEPGQTKEHSSYQYQDHYNINYQAHYSHRQVEPSPGVSIGIVADRYLRRRHHHEVVVACHLYVREGVRKPHCLANTSYNLGRNLWVVTVRLQTG